MLTIRPSLLDLHQCGCSVVHLSLTILAQSFYLTSQGSWCLQHSSEDTTEDACIPRTRFQSWLHFRLQLPLSTHPGWQKSVGPYHLQGRPRLSSQLLASNWSDHSCHRDAGSGPAHRHSWSSLPFTRLHKRGWGKNHSDIHIRTRSENLADVGPAR